jgi:putative MATE family efflux protein
MNRDDEHRAAARADRFLTRHFSGGTMDYRQIGALIIPLLIDQTFIVCTNLFNTSMISSSGMTAVSAVNMVDSVNVFLLNILIAVATGGTVIVAQYKGRGNHRDVPRAVSGSVTSVLIISFAIALMVILLAPAILAWLFGGAEREVLNYARIYLIGSASSYVFFGMMEAVSAALRGLGETRSSLVLTLTMNGLYVVLNLLLIQVFSLGIVGLVISLVTARVLAAILSIFFLVRKKNLYRLAPSEIFRLDFPMLRRAMALGFPFAAEQMFFNGGKILTQTFIVGMGTLAIATNAITASLTSLFMIPANTLTLAIITVVGQCVGNRDIEQARKSLRSFSILTSAAIFLMALVLLPWMRDIVSIFRPPEAIVGEILLITYINTAAQMVLWPGSFLVPSALRAAGDARFTSVVSMLSMWLFRVILGYVIGVLLGWGVRGVWFAMQAEWGVRGLIFLLRLRGSKWYRHKVID